LTRSLSSALAPIFTGPDLHVPSRDKAKWILGEMRQHGLLPEAVGDTELLAGFRPDLYAQTRK
jgi:hypothetical protein